MSIALTPEQEAIKKRAYDAGLEYQEAAFKWDEEDAVDYRSVSDRFGELGFFGLTAPEEWGGQGGDCVDYLLAVSEAIRAAGSWIVGEPMFCTTGPGPSMLMLSDNQALKDKYLRDVVTGVKGCAIALTEPLHGSDLTYLETTAARDGDNIIINGSKSFVTGAMYNELYACFVRFDDIPGPRGIGAVVIDADAPGFSMSRGPVFLGTRSIPHGDVEVEPVVAGYYGSSSRLIPQHEQDDDSLPSSLFLKMATENQGGRENAAQGGMYRFKVGFYRDLAGLHTPTWQGRGMESCDWAKIDATTANAFAQGMMKLKRSILGRFGAELSGSNIEILDRLTVSAPGYWRYSLECENQVAAHWDFRGDNMLFGQRNGELAMVTID